MPPQPVRTDERPFEEAPLSERQGAGPSGPGLDGSGAELAGESYVLRLPPELRSVGRARAKLGELARLWRTAQGVLDDAKIVLSELMSNGVLHARTDLEVLLSQRGTGLHIEVHDSSSVPLLPLPDHSNGSSSLLDGPGPSSSEEPSPAATGRGLHMVGVLASSWGWFPDAAGGKVVWAEVGTSVPGEARAGGQSSSVPHTLRPVRLIALPTRLLKASEDHLDDLFRELQMANLALPARAPVAARSTRPGPSGLGGRGTGVMDGARPQGHTSVGDLAPQAEQVKARLARLREPVRRAIWEATRRGDRLIDLNLLADSGTPAVLQSASRLLAHAALAARKGLLLIEPPPTEVVHWWEWLQAEIVYQVGGKPPRACPFPVTPLSGAMGGAAWAALGSARSEALVKLRTVFQEVQRAAEEEGETVDLPGSPDDRHMVDALRRLIGYVGARRSVLSLLADDNETVRFGLSVGFSPDVADFWQSYSLSADLPASECIRTNRAVLFRTFAELDARYPVFLSTPAESDPALACMPLPRPGGGALGCLVLGFPQARDFSAREVAFLEQLAAQVAASILARRRLAQARAQATLRSKVDQAIASMALLTSGDDVLRQLVDTVVVLVCDGASAHTVDKRGAVRYLVARHRDPERLQAVVTLLQRRQRDGTSSRGQDLLGGCARTGQPSVLQLLTDEVVSASAADEEDMALLRRIGLGSVGVMPVRAGKAIVAVISFGNNIGRFISEADISVIERLAASAGEVLTGLGF